MTNILRTGIIDTHKRYHFICDKCFCEFITESAKQLTNDTIFADCPMCGKRHVLSFETLKNMFVAERLSKKIESESEYNNFVDKAIVEYLREAIKDEV